MSSQFLLAVIIVLLVGLFIFYMRSEFYKSMYKMERNHTQFLEEQEARRFKDLKCSIK